jgi:hypothetical protein
MVTFTATGGGGGNAGSPPQGAGKPIPAIVQPAKEELSPETPK